MRIRLNPRTDRGIMVMEMYGYDLKNLFINAIHTFNGEGDTYVARADSECFERMIKVTDRRTFMLPDKEINGKTHTFLNTVPEEDRGFLLKEMVRATICVEPYMRHHITGTSQSISDRISDQILAKGKGEGSRKQTGSIGKQKAIPDRSADNRESLPETICKGDRQGCAGMQIQYREEDKALNDDGHIRKGRECLEKSDRKEGHQYIESEDYLIDIDDYSEDPCSGLSEQIDWTGYKSVTDMIVRVYLRVNGYLNAYNAARAAGTAFDLDAEERKHPPRQTLDVIIEKLRKGAEKKEARSVKQADDLQNSVSMQQFMTNLDYSMQHPVNQI